MKYNIIPKKALYELRISLMINTIIDKINTRNQNNIFRLYINKEEKDMLNDALDRLAQDGVKLKPINTDQDVVYYRYLED